jgi:putative flippase GtrA
MYLALGGQAQRSAVDAVMKAKVIDAQADGPACPMLGSMRLSPAAVRLAFFVAVGCCAAAVHWSVVVWLVGGHGWMPLVANLVGWLVAFSVSFLGHFSLTFRGHGAGWVQAVSRFFLISAGGFAINEAAYAVLLRWSGHRYDLVLAAVLVAVAGVTYVLSRHWAFLRSEAPALPPAGSS